MNYSLFSRVMCLVEKLRQSWCNVFTVKSYRQKGYSRWPPHSIWETSYSSTTYSLSWADCADWSPFASISWRFRESLNSSMWMPLGGSSSQGVSTYSRRPSKQLNLVRYLFLFKYRMPVSASVKKRGVLSQRLSISALVLSSVWPNT